MANQLDSVINVKVNHNDKIKANKILNDLGLNMSTLINMTIKQVIKKNGIPFEINNSESLPKELIDALDEAKEIEKDIINGKRTGYKTINELMEALSND